MGGDEYVRHLLGSASKDLDRTKFRALEAIFNRMCNRGVDPIEFFDSIRELMGPLPLKLYKLDSYHDTFDCRHSVVLANDEVEARVIASNDDECFLDNSSCELVDTKTVGVVSYYQEC